MVAWAASGRGKTRVVQCAMRNRRVKYKITYDWSSFVNPNKNNQGDADRQGDRLTRPTPASQTSIHARALGSTARDSLSLT